MLCYDTMPLVRGIAQLVARCVWDAEVPSSSLGTPTDFTELAGMV